MLKAFLQGKPFRHPLHAGVVHFPIGLFALSLVLDIASYLGFPQGDFVSAAFYAIAIGLATGTIAVVAGLADRSDIRLDHPSRKTANLHMTLNLLALGLFGLNLLLRAGEQDTAETPIVYLLLSLVGFGIILFSGYLGGTMVYDNGVGVGRHRRDTPAPRQTITVSKKKSQAGWVAVCDDSDLREGETLRVDYAGNIIALAKWGGEVYAFQEFCTHRYGPLSEGRIQDYQVECPWHRSCFDLRTGKVTMGPARINLGTYSAAIREGKVWVR